MGKGYSTDFRLRTVAVADQADSARAASRLMNVAPSTAIRWAKRWVQTGSVDAKPAIGHSRSPLKEYEAWLLDLVAREPDLTLEEIRDRLAASNKLDVAVSSIWRFYDRHDITFKKNSARPHAAGVSSTRRRIDLMLLQHGRSSRLSNRN